MHRRMTGWDFALTVALAIGVVAFGWVMLGDPAEPHKVVAVEAMAALAMALSAKVGNARHR